MALLDRNGEDAIYPEFIGKRSPILRLIVFTLETMCVKSAGQAVIASCDMQIGCSASAEPGHVACMCVYVSVVYVVTRHPL